MQRDIDCCESVSGQGTHRGAYIRPVQFARAHALHTSTLRGSRNDWNNGGSCGRAHGISSNLCPRTDGHKGSAAKALHIAPYVAAASIFFDDASSRFAKQAGSSSNQTGSPSYSPNPDGRGIARLSLTDMRYSARRESVFTLLPSAK